MRVRNPNVQRIIETQVKSWFGDLTSPEVQGKWMPPILISRERGAVAEEVAERLSQRLGWPVYDKELILQIAEAAKEDPKRIEFLDETSRGIFWEFTEAFLRSAKVLQDEYVVYLRRFIKTLGKIGRCIIVGRGANFIIAPDKALRVRLIGRPEGWKEALIRRHGLKEEELEEVLKRWNAEQRQFIRKYFDADVTDPHNYDLVLNLDHYSWDTASELILEAYKGKFPSFNIAGLGHR